MKTGRLHLPSGLGAIRGYSITCRRDGLEPAINYVHRGQWPAGSLNGHGALDFRERPTLGFFAMPTDYLPALPNHTTNATMGPDHSKHAERRQLVHSTPSHPWPHYFEPSGKTPRAPLMVLWALWYATTPIDEVKALCAGMTDRNRHMVMSRLGALGHPPPTYNTIAKKFGISRARVGQLVNRFVTELTSWGLRLPWCECLLDDVHMRNGIVHLSETDEQMANSLHAIVKLSELGTISSRLLWNSNTESWTSEHGLRHIEQYRELLAANRGAINTQRRQWGAFRLDLLPHSDIIPTRAAIRVATPASVVDYDLDNGLVVFPNAKSVLATTARKALAALGSLAIADLHCGISQHHRLTMPTVDETRDILSIHREFVVDLHDNATLIDTPDAEAVLTAAERTALQIMEDADGVIDNDGYLYCMEKAGFRRELAGAVLRAPFITRIERAVYALRGHDIGPGKIQSAKLARLNRFRASLVSSERDSSCFRLHYRVSSPCLREGRLPLPAAGGLPQGRWRASFPDGTTGTVSVRNSSIRGLRPWMRRANVAIDAPISIEVEKRTRIIRVLQPD